MAEIFYKDGLRFSCIGCGKCCTIEDGLVYLRDKDIERLAKFLHISRENFLKKYTHRENKHRVLNDFPNGNCIFHRPNTGCVVYSARPIQCRTFPFWDSILVSKQVWEYTATECQGMNIGRLYSAEEIEKIKNGKMDT
ncbi:YkgJ family cysteine cluster protein [bacterium]|nr:YkgJ family cysteine cluster protein [bacterium]